MLKVFCSWLPYKGDDMRETPPDEYYQRTSDRREKKAKLLLEDDFILYYCNWVKDICENDRKIRKLYYGSGISNIHKKIRDCADTLMRYLEAIGISDMDPNMIFLFNLSGVLPHSYTDKETKKKVMVPGKDPELFLKWDKKDEDDKKQILENCKKYEPTPDPQEIGINHSLRFMEGFSDSRMLFSRDYWGRDRKGVTKNAQELECLWWLLPALVIYLELNGYKEKWKVIHEILDKKILDKKKFLNF